MRFTILLLTFAACSGTDEKSDTGDTDGGGGLSQDDFGDQFVERYCAEWDACNTGGDGCPIGGTTTTTGTSTYECDYDAVAAQACLDGTWGCNTDFPGLEFPITPNVCSTICGDSTYTTPSTSTP